MILVADGGSTKTNWCLVDRHGKRLTFNSEGFNPYFVSTAYIASSLSRVLPQDLKKDEVGEIYFYGAGVQNEDKAEIIKNALVQIFPNSRQSVSHDLLGSARALLGFETGFAGILGTGTNSCIYDGAKIIKHIDSGAHILGDEGSGFYIGKRLLIDFLRGGMPSELAAGFKERYNLTSDLVHEAVYTKPLANKYCASFASFIAGNYKNYEYTQKLLFTAFNDFFRNIVSLYPDYERYRFNCVGSIAFSFADILEEVSNGWGMEFGRVIKAPLDSLVDYHFSALEHPASLKGNFETGDELTGSF